jgi:hypothetical protein
MICSVLGYDSDKVVDSSILGLLRAICPPTTQLMARLCFSQFIADSLHDQLNDFSLNRSCRFQSYLVYLLLFSKMRNFQNLSLEIEDKSGNPLSVIHWTPVVRLKLQNVGFIDYVNYFMSIAYTLFHEENPPRIFPGVKSLLHESSETNLGDWYLFEDYTEIRMYGSEVKPFKFPSFLTMRVFCFGIY